MKVRFYPRDIGMFRNGDFDFSLRGGDILLIARTIYDYKDFYDRHELITYLSSCGVRLDDANYPLSFEFCEKCFRDKNMYAVRQWTLIGWMEEI